MTATGPYRRQHEELVQALEKVQRRMTTAEVQGNATEIRALLSALLGKLSAHLAAEDAGLYPALLRHADPEVRRAAARFQAEMGSLSASVTAYQDRWASPSAMAADAAAFLAESRALFRALSERVVRENTVLFALAERAS